MISLYQKYRPKRFDALYIGQEFVSKSLTNSILMNRIGHAYLFTGLKGSGKTTSARIFANAVNCLNSKNQNGNPCLKCKNCQTILKKEALDIIEIDAASNRGIDEIREIKENIQVAPVTLPYKVYIIDEVHMLTKDAFNALLKTLEEPPSHAIFILVTTEVNKIPSTILSRVQRFDFEAFTKEDLKKSLTHIAKEEKITIDNKSLNIIIKSSGGSSRDSLSLLDKLITFEGKNINFKKTSQILGFIEENEVLSFAKDLIEKNFSSCLETINNLNQKNINWVLFANELNNFFRAFLLKKINSSQIEEILKKQYSNLLIETIDETIDLATGQEITSLLKKFIYLKEELKKTEDKKTLIELILFESFFLLNSDKDKKRNNINLNLNKKESTKQELENEKSIDLKKKNSSGENTLWLNFLNKVRTKNIPLASFLKSCSISQNDNNNFVLNCKTTFHKTQFEKPENKDVIKSIIKETYNLDNKPNLIYEIGISNSKINNKNEPEENKKAKQSSYDLAKSIFGK